ncbi:unnamed protein product [Caenorhabditis angaria]|uniref:Uncharacterized protein n=1 Tax=Caenorhabditis angaria TaxID=860376 RepID=A0A9P1IZX5_9PELO|nr:unnamed protein product [Caenorhabditis angaria]
MFYWLAESENNVTTDPLIFWFNGGPGCSSLTGLFFNGPINVDSMGQELSKNEYSLTKLGSVVYIESPSPVGFSYSTDDSDPDIDYMTAEDNYNAVEMFFEEYPKFRNHDVFLTGVSYAGIYVPMLAGHIIDHQKDSKINLKGIALSGPLLSEKLNIKSRLEYSYSHGIIDENVYRSFLEQCCNNNLEKCNLVGEKCNGLRSYANFLYHPEMDIYQINRKCEQSSENRRPNSCSFKSGLKCEDYLNRNDTRKILRIPEEAGIWKRCQRLHYFNLEIEMDEYIKKMLKNNIKIVLYFGDMDMVCPFSAGQKIVDRLGIEEIGNGLITKNDQEIIGKYTSYKNLDLLVFKNAGHYVGGIYPESQFELHRKFFKNQKLNVL